MDTTLTVRVALPHYFRETLESSGYGSGRQGATGSRSLALARCLAALLQLERASDDLVLNIGERCLNATGGQRGLSPLTALQMEIHVFTTGGHYLHGVLAGFAGAVTVHDVNLEDPRTLALAARDFLVRHPQPLDLALYLEDDLVIGDPLFLDKQAWFLARCQHQAVLMPHRYELVPGKRGQRLLVDGPLRPDFINRFATPVTAGARGRFWDSQEVSFDRTANPHAGLFCLSQPQLEKLKDKALPNEGFIGPLETAATLTALAYFPVLKPSLENRGFLWVEHGHPSFQGYTKSLKIAELKSD
jgi:hypothetical protein